MLKPASPSARPPAASLPSVSGPQLRSCPAPCASFKEALSAAARSLSSGALNCPESRPQLRSCPAPCASFKEALSAAAKSPSPGALNCPESRPFEFMLPAKTERSSGWPAKPASKPLTPPFSSAANPSLSRSSKRPARPNKINVMPYTIVMEAVPTLGKYGVRQKTPKRKAQADTFFSLKISFKKLKKLLHLSNRLGATSKAHMIRMAAPIKKVAAAVFKIAKIASGFTVMLS